MIRRLALALALSLLGCRSPLPAEDPAPATPFLQILGIAQDAGAPQLGCRAACCEALRASGTRLPATSVALVDPQADRAFLVDATPDLREQLHAPSLAPHVHATRRPVDGILLTHAHVGHYLGLAYLGRESLAADRVPVHATERFCAFLRSQAPWDLLVAAGHVELVPFEPEQERRLSPRLAVTPFLVPHRDEYTDTVGFEIRGPARRLVYLPDVDALDDALWTRLTTADVVLLDGTFFRDGELGERDMTSIPHPRMERVLERYRALAPDARPELVFVHLNHTNPALRPDSAEAHAVRRAGARVGRVGERLPL